MILAGETHSAPVSFLYLRSSGVGLPQGLSICQKRPHSNLIMEEIKWIG